MSERFYEKFTSFFLKFIFLMLIISMLSSLFTFWVFTQNMVLLYSYLLGVTILSVYIAYFFLRFRIFKEKISLYIPKAHIKNSIEPLNIELEDLPLKVCLYYRNGASLADIQKALGFSHPNQVKRKLIEGLDMLLKSYNEGER